jgi:hypothetical protein
MSFHLRGGVVHTTQIETVTFFRKSAKRKGPLTRPGKLAPVPRRTCAVLRQLISPPELAKFTAILRRQQSSNVKMWPGQTRAHHSPALATFGGATCTLGPLASDTGPGRRHSKRPSSRVPSREQPARPRALLTSVSGRPPPCRDARSHPSLPFQSQPLKACPSLLR